MKAEGNFRKRGIAWIPCNNGNLFCDPPEAIDDSVKQLDVDIFGSLK